MKGVMRFRKKGKLSPWYIGPYRISKRVGNVAYELELPQELAAVTSVLHVSMFNKCMGDPSLIIPTEYIGIKDSLSYEEIHVHILDRHVRKLRTKEAQSVTNQNNQQGPVPANASGGSLATRLCDFVKMNPPEFLGSQIAVGCSSHLVHSVEREQGYYWKIIPPDLGVAEEEYQYQFLHYHHFVLRLP
ncbi:hypothetical protein MTR67_039542 [Solanum verrucosum]|uniref:Tf2-1-like SH3-like domain-containing protein n=1 Tax=Solanum verrucosum TaxID=315347 RepID=A0AAF0ZNP0_SOLVR|nr:hypothetical protein MTR67_039542 [Solanum verrucosum]